jgi:hypothetical protein
MPDGRMIASPLVEVYVGPSEKIIELDLEGLSVIVTVSDVKLLMFGLDVATEVMRETEEDELLLIVAGLAGLRLVSARDKDLALVSGGGILLSELDEPGNTPVFDI